VIAVKRKWSIGEPDVRIPAFNTFRIYHHAGDVCGDKLYFYGGFLVGQLNASEMITGDVFCLDFASLSISKLPITDPNRRPRTRIDHAATTFQNSLVVLGGKSEHGEFRNDIWMLSLCRVI